MTDAVVPYLCCAGASDAIDWYVAVFDGEQVDRMTDDAGRVSHAEVRIGGHPVFLADEHPELGVRSPAAFGGTPVSLVVTVTDAEAIVARAVSRGATLDRPVEDQGDFRIGWIVDPFGHRWGVTDAG
jgi:PhnB protein